MAAKRVGPISKLNGADWIRGDEYHQFITSPIQKDDKNLWCVLCAGRGKEQINGHAFLMPLPWRFLHGFTASVFWFVCQSLISLSFFRFLRKFLFLFIVYPWFRFSGFSFFRILVEISVLFGNFFKGRVWVFWEFGEFDILGLLCWINFDALGRKFYLVPN